MHQGSCLCGKVRFKVANKLEAPAATALERHIFVADKGDYYEMGDGLPQNLS